MVSMDAFASAFGFDAKSDDVWTCLGKVTAITSGKASVLLGGSATPTLCECYCPCAVGDTVFVVISKGVARIIARRGIDTVKGPYDAMLQLTGTNGQAYLQSGTASSGGIMQLAVSGNDSVPYFRKYDGSSWSNWHGLVYSDMTPTTSTSNIITANTSNATISSAQFAKWGKLAMLQVTFTNKNAITVSTSNLGNIEIGTLAADKRPAISCAPVSEGDGAGIVHYYINTSGSVKICQLDKRDSSYTIAAGTSFYLYATYILA